MKGAARLEFENPIHDAISRIRFSPRSNNLLISSWDSIGLRLFDVDSSALKLEAKSESPILDCCFQDESYAFSAAADGSVTRYDLRTGVNDTVGSHDGIATCIEYYDETRQVITSGLDKKMISWDMRMAKPLASSRNLNAEVDSMSLSGSNLMIGMGTSVTQYDLRNLDRPLLIKELHRISRIKCVSWMPYSKGYAVGSVDGRVALEVCASSNLHDMGYSFRCHPKEVDRRNHLVSVNDIAFNPLYNNLLVTGDNEGHVIAWDARNRRRKTELSRIPNSVASLSYNHDGQLLAVASSYTYQELNEKEDPPEIFVFQIDDICNRSTGKSNCE